jgi:hypothetical protein
MKNIINALVSVFILLSLNSCSKELKTYELTIYTFGNEIKPNDKFPEDIKQLLEPLGKSCLSKVFFEDKIYGWKNNIDIENLSKLKNGLSHENKNGNSTLLEQFFENSENNKLYDNKSDKNDKKAFNYDMFYTMLKQDTSKTILIYSADENITNQKNVFNKITSLRKQIDNININEPWKEIIVFYKPENKVMTETEEDVENGLNNPKKGKDAELPGTEDKPKRGKSVGENKTASYKYPEQSIRLTADVKTISWNSFNIQGDDIEYTVKINRYHGGELLKNTLFESKIKNNKSFSLSDCKECMELPSGRSALLFTVLLGDVTIGTCKFSPNNEGVTNCHCTENKITASK